MRVERIGQATLYLADSADMVTSLDFDSFVTDPPDGYAVMGLPTPIGPYVIKLIVYGRKMFDEDQHRGIVFPGRRQLFLYPPPTAVAKVLTKGLEALPVLFYGLESRDMYCDGLDEIRDVRHPGAKPIEWFTWAVAKTQGTVIDPFMGSGTCGIACAELGRPFIGIEVVEQYFDLACERIEKAYNSLKLSA